MPGTQPAVFSLKAELFRVLGHPARVRILDLLRDEERNVGDLQTALGIDASGTSQHLAALRKVGLVETRRDGTSVYYRLRDPRALHLLVVVGQILSSNLAEQQTLLHELSTASSPATALGPRAPRRGSTPSRDR